MKIGSLTIRWPFVWRRSDPAEFVANADRFVDALGSMASELNALADYLDRSAVAPARPSLIERIGRVTVAAGVIYSAIQLHRIARLLSSSRGDGLLIRTDADTPIPTEVPRG